MVERVHLRPPWQVAQLKLGMTRPSWPNSCRPRWAAGSVSGTGAWLVRTFLAIQTAIASWRASRPALLAGRKLVTPGGFDRPSPRRATDRLPRVTQSPLGVPAGPGVGPLVPTLYSKMVVWSAPVPSTPPIT